MKVQSSKFKVQSLKGKIFNYFSQLTTFPPTLLRSFKAQRFPMSKVWKSSSLQQFYGFTLLELLVVISILAILITLALTSYSTVQKKGRDAKRKSDIKDIQSALEQYYSVCGFTYPTPTGFYSQGIYCTNPTIGILPTVPSDPRGTPPYYCSGTCDASGFQVCAVLEGESPTGFCVKNQQ